MQDEAMDGHVFAHWARKYWERGLSVIPCVGKQPVTKVWQQYANALPTEETLTEWEKSYGACNIGLACGPASGVIALDLDLDSLIKHPDLPSSPLIRRGRKGEVRFFKYRAGISSRAFKYLKLDLISAGKQVILPPSIHPETKIPYVWINSDDFSDLPELPENILATLERLERVAEQSHLKARKAGEIQEAELPGRNNRLKEIACAMFGRGEPFENVVHELIREDSTHKKPLFTDASEGNAGESYANAVRFAASILQSMARKGGIVDLAPPVSQEVKIGNLIDESPTMSKLPTWKPPVPGSGLLRLAYDYQVDIANDECPSLFLGGALAFVSALLGNKFVYKNTAPNLYIMNIAKSGHGKSWPYRLIGEFAGKLGIVGFDGIASASALVQDFGAQPWRTRIDPLDEVGEMLKNIKKGTSSQAGIVDAMCRLWDCSNGYYNGKKYSDRSKNVPSCWQPYHVVLASTTPNNMKENHEKIWSDKGFLPRFLLFFEQSEFGFKKTGGGEGERKYINEAIERIMGMDIPMVHARTGEIYEPQQGTVDLGGSANEIKFAPIELTAEPRAEALLEKLEETYRIEKMRLEADFLGGSANGFVARHYQLLVKLAIIHAVSENLDETRVIYLESVLWAQAVVDGLWESSRSFLDEIHSVGDWDKESKKLLMILAAAPKKTLARREIVRKLRLPIDLSTKLLSFLEESGQIVKILPKLGEFVGPGRRPERYKLLSSDEQKADRMREELGVSPDAEKKN